MAWIITWSRKKWSERSPKTYKGCSDRVGYACTRFLSGWKKKCCFVSREGCGRCIKALLSVPSASGALRRVSMLLKFCVRSASDYLTSQYSRAPRSERSRRGDILRRVATHAADSYSRFSAKRALHVSAKQHHSSYLRFTVHLWLRKYCNAMWKTIVGLSSSELYWCIVGLFIETTVGIMNSLEMLCA